MDVGHERNRHNSSSPDNNNELFPSMSPDKLEFYKTYDVMTGVRIAATLGGFFSLMVLLVVYKSKCKSRSVSEEDLAAVAAAVVEEEERKETERRLSLYGGGRGQSAARGRPSVVAPGPPFTYHPPLPVGVYTRHHSLTPSPPMTTYNQLSRFCDFGTWFSFFLNPFNYSEDNVPAKISICLELLNTDLKMEIINLQNNVEDLALTDYHLFRSLEHYFSNKKFENLTEIEIHLNELFSPQDEHFFKSGFEN